MSTGLLERLAGRPAPVREGRRPVTAERQDPQQVPWRAVAPRQDGARPVRPGFRVYGDFNCPWSYLAFRRAAVLARAGFEVDWRAVEHSAWTPRRHDDRAARFATLRAEAEQVVGLLLPGEQLPYDLAGFMPRTRAAVAAYAEGYAAGVAAPVRRLIFESFWMHGIDIGDATVLRTLLTDELRTGHSPSEIVRTWGLPVDVTGAPISSDAWRLVESWGREWSAAAQQVVPVVQLAGEPPILGASAVEWLGDQIVLHRLEPELPAEAVPDPVDARELPGRGWVTAQGGAWLVSFRQARAEAARRDG